MREAGRILMVFKNTSPLKAFTPWPLEAPMDMGQRGAAGSLKGEGVGRGRPSCGEANEADPGLSVMYYRDWSPLGFSFLFTLKKCVGITSMWNRRHHCFGSHLKSVAPFYRESLPCTLTPQGLFHPAGCFGSVGSQG